MTPRLAILPDYREEGWPSMDLCADMLLAHLPPTVTAAECRPAFRSVATRLAALGRMRAVHNADRVVNRHVLYPRAAHRAAGRFDLFHIVDHSYAQLAHALPADRTGVYCHDLDAFRCLLDPARDPRPRWFRALACRTLSGLRKAAVVFHGTTAVRDELLAAGLVEPARLVSAPYGVAAEFTPISPANAPSPSWVARLGDRPWVAHVGSCAPRKRIDVLLDVIAALRADRPDLLLVKVGGDWTADQAGQIARHRLGDAIVHLRDLTRADLAEVYRRAAAVLVPSEAEGFGLPVVEALACGAVVVASDIPALREAGGPAAVYAPVGDVSAWAAAVSRVLANPASAPARSERLAWAARFSWSAHATTIADAYLKLFDRVASCG